MEKNNNAQNGNHQEQLKQIFSLAAKIELQEKLIIQLTHYNETLQMQLKASESGCKTLYKYICELHKCLDNNFHRTPIEEILYHEIGRYIKTNEEKKKIKE